MRALSTSIRDTSDTLTGTPPTSPINASGKTIVGTGPLKNYTVSDSDIQLSKSFVRDVLQAFDSKIDYGRLNMKLEESTNSRELSEVGFAYDGDNKALTDLITSYLNASVLDDVLYLTLSPISASTDVGYVSKTSSLPTDLLYTGWQDDDKYEVLQTGTSSSTCFLVLFKHDDEGHYASVSYEDLPVSTSFPQRIPPYLSFNLNRNRYIQAILGSTDPGDLFKSIAPVVLYNDFNKQYPQFIMLGVRMAVDIKKITPGILKSVFKSGKTAKAVSKWLAQKMKNPDDTHSVPPDTNSSITRKGTNDSKRTGKKSHTFLIILVIIIVIVLLLSLYMMMNKPKPFYSLGYRR